MDATATTEKPVNWRSRRAKIVSRLDRAITEQEEAERALREALLLEDDSGPASAELVRARARAATARDRVRELEGAVALAETRARTQAEEEAKARVAAGRNDAIRLGDAALQAAARVDDALAALVEAFAGYAAVTDALADAVGRCLPETGLAALERHGTMQVSMRRAARCALRANAPTLAGYFSVSDDAETLLDQELGRQAGVIGLDRMRQDAAAARRKAKAAA